MVPLLLPDDDVTLVHYERLLNYDEPPPPPTSSAEAEAWVTTPKG
jgi:hypothetical protein